MPSRRAGSQRKRISNSERRSGSTTLRIALDGVASSCAHDNDYLCLPANMKARSGGAEKEAPAPRISQACRGDRPLLTAYRSLRRAIALTAMIIYQLRSVISEQVRTGAARARKACHGKGAVVANEFTTMPVAILFNWMPNPIRSAVPKYDPRASV